MRHAARRRAAVQRSHAGGHRAAPPRTLVEFVRYGEQRFRAARLHFGHGLPSAYDEAARLALHALGLTPDQFEQNLERSPSAHQAGRILKLFRQRIATRKPAAYLTGVAYLGGYRFSVDERVIVPRSYIAELLHQELAPWIADPRRVRAALDLCTGSGCLAVLLAHAFARAQVDATDISRAALQVARRNVAAYGLKDRIRLIRSDLYGALRGRRYDLIVSNPPYVTAAAMRRLPREHRHEPRLALAGGRDGLDLVKGILAEAAAHLNPKGLLVVEVGHGRNRVERAFPRTPFTWPHTSAGDSVFLIARADLPNPMPAAAPARAKAR